MAHKSRNPGAPDSDPRLLRRFQADEIEALGHANIIDLSLPKTPSSLMVQDLRDSRFEGVSATIHPNQALTGRTKWAPAGSTVPPA